MVASGAGEREACAALLDAGATADAATPAPAGVTALMRAASSGRTGVIQLLLDRAHVDPNVRAGPKLHGATALYLAAQGSHAAAVEALLQGGALVDVAVTEVGATALFVASERGCAKTVSMLLRHGADPRLTNWNGLNAAHMAALRGHLAVLDELERGGVREQAGGHPDEREGKRALDELERGGVREQAGGHPNGREGKRATQGQPVHVDARQSSATPPLWEARSADGSTALILVAAGDEGLSRSRQQRTIRWLLGRGAAVEARRSDGCTALLVAVSAGQVTAARLLLSEGKASPSAARDDGQTALAVAVERGDAAIARALLDAGAVRSPRALEAAIAKRDHELIAILSAGSTADEHMPDNTAAAEIGTAI